MTTKTILACAAAALALAPAAAAQGPTTPEGYCEPENTQYDPKDLVREHVPPLVLPDGFTRRRVAVDGLSTVVTKRGPSHLREAVVFIHGTPGSSGDYARLLDAAPRGSRVVALDLVGFGEASKPWGFPYSVETAAAFVSRLLDTLGIRRVHLVGHDLGGLLGTEWAAAHPDRLASAVLFATPGPLYQKDHFHLAWTQPVLGEELMHGTTRATFVPVIQAHNPRPLPDEFLQRDYDFFDRAMRCAVLEGYRASDPAAFAREHAEKLRRYDKPALAIFGDRDPFVHVHNALTVRGTFPSAFVHVFEESGHWPFVDHEARTRRLVRAFLDPIVSQRAGSLRRR